MRRLSTAIIVGGAGFYGGWLSAELLAEDANLEFQGELRPGDPLRWDGDASRARAPGARFDTPLAEGLRRIVEWLVAAKEPHVVG